MKASEAIETLIGIRLVSGYSKRREEALDMAIAALEKQEGKKPITVETNIYDTEEIHHGCTVQVLRNSVTGDVSVGWWKEEG